MGFQGFRLAVQESPKNGRRTSHTSLLRPLTMTVLVVGTIHGPFCFREGGGREVVMERVDFRNGWSY